MQGAEDSHVSQAMLTITEVIAMPKDDSHPSRMANATVMLPPPDRIPTGPTSVSGLTTEAQEVREVLLEVKQKAWERPL